jgi:hypothetical protein
MSKPGAEIVSEARRLASVSSDSKLAGVVKILATAYEETDNAMDRMLEALEGVTGRKAHA